MSMSVQRMATWGGLGLLCALVIASCARESVGFDKYHEVVCQPDDPQACAPSGRRLVVTRKPGDALARPARLPSIRIDVLSDTDLLEAHIDQINCVMPDANNFICRTVLGMALDSSQPALTAPWRMVQGRLLNDTLDPTRVRFLDSQQLWRARLGLGSYAY
ncbi:MAG: hypothetical protein QE285_17370 [Aquabacterium sp.]|nr:hypothetical protein [Aquabacterium sp.]